MARGPGGRVTETGETVVTLNPDGTGTAAILFLESFVDAPAILVVPRRGEAGTYEAISVTRAGFVLSVEASDIASQDLSVPWVAVEKS